MATRNLKPGVKNSLQKLLSTIHYHQDGCATAGQLSRIFGYSLVVMREKLKKVDAFGKMGREMVWKYKEVEEALLSTDTSEPEPSEPRTKKKRKTALPDDAGFAGEPLPLSIPFVASDDDIEGLDAAKLRRAIADAERAELNVLERQGELVSAAAMRGLVMEIMQILYKRFCVVGPRELGITITEAVRGGGGSREVSEYIRQHAIRVFNDVGQTRLFSGAAGTDIARDLAERHTDRRADN